MLWNFLKSLFSVTFDTEKQHTESSRWAKQGYYYEKRPEKPVNYYLTTGTGNLCTLLGIEERESVFRIIRYPETYYRIFRIPKKNGNYRVIAAPHSPLYYIQKKIYDQILSQAWIHPAAQGFRKNMSFVSNAREHLGNEYILKADLRNFFPSIHLGRVIAVFRNLGYEYSMAYKLAYLCCLNGRLPQGSPASPALSNIIACSLDVKLQAIAQQYNLSYTRYADDITFSGRHLFKGEVLKQINKAVESENFVLNKKKTRYIGKGKRKIITGVSVGSGKMTIPRSKKRELRKIIYFILTKGITGHLQHINSNEPDSWYLERVLGYLAYWHAIEPENTYVKNSVSSIRKLMKL